jgi:hypothetical protein
MAYMACIPLLEMQVCAGLLALSAFRSFNRRVHQPALQWLKQEEELEAEHHEFIGGTFGLVGPTGISVAPLI